jgi:hypothetical protein
MGATSKYPTSGDGGSNATGFYQNAMQNAKQQVANVGQTQQAQAKPGQPPNTPGDASSSLDAYNNYMAKAGPQNNPPFRRSQSEAAPPPNYSAIFGGDWNTQASAAPAMQPPGSAPQPPGNTPPTQQRTRPGQKPPQGITMGAGRASRSFE